MELSEVLVLLIGFIAFTEVLVLQAQVLSLFTVVDTFESPVE